MRDVLEFWIQCRRSKWPPSASKHCRSRRTAAWVYTFFWATLYINILPLCHNNSTPSPLQGQCDIERILNSWFRASWFNVNKKAQLDATVCRHLFTAKSLYMFRASQHPSSGVLKTVTATSVLIRPRWKEVAVPVLWPIPEVAVTVFSTPDDDCCDARNM